MYLAFSGGKAHSFLRCVKRSVTTPKSKETELRGKVTSKQLRAEFQHNNLPAKGSLVGVGDNVEAQ